MFGQSSKRRFPKRSCYTGLLHKPGRELQLNALKTVRKRESDCYTALLHNRPVGLFLRNGQFYYRRRLPHDVRSLLGRAEIWRSLRTDSLRRALRRLPCMAAQVEFEIEMARSMAGMPVDLALLEPSNNNPQIGTGSGCRATDGSDPSFVVDEASRLTFGDAYARYLTDPTQAWSARTREAYETSRRLAVSVIGKDVPICTMSRAHVRDYLDVLRFLPRNATKRFPRLTARQAADHARERGDPNLISAANANACIGNLSSFLNWAVNEELLARNPVKGLRLPDDTAKKDKRSPFSPGQLRLIFDAPLYRGCLNGERGYAKPGIAPQPSVRPASKPRTRRSAAPRMRSGNGALEGKPPDCVNSQRFDGECRKGQGAFLPAPTPTDV